jgi:serine/threonine protein kinase/Flp pilus assembly protein TadD
MQAAKLAPGNMLLQFRLSAQIGTGGMGVVWKAFDTALERHVALKCLPAEFSNEPAHLARFEREAKLLAALNHPNVATIYGLHTANGLRFLTMELVDGSDLRRHLLKTGALPLTTALRVAADTAAGLAAAHAVGIVHRDLKPGNICLTAAGTAKVLDFGLGKRSPQPGVDATTELADTSGTTPGTVLGTAKYMSPEQARGELADLRCDVWAFGAVMYEMLVGDPPFTGRSYAEVIGAVLKDEPNWDKLPSDTPETIRTLLIRCLTKSAEDRPPDILGAREVIVDALTRSTVGGPESYPISSVAVLPFVNMSADPATQYFGDGLAEDLINALTRVPRLHVASRTSSFRFRSTAIDVRKIGEQLNVRAVVEGSVRHSGNKLRVTVQVTNVRNGYNLWSERYDRELTDVFDIQDDIVTSVVKALTPALIAEAPRTWRRPTENSEAYQLYLEGRHYWHQRSPGTMRVAIRCFRGAVQLDPRYAHAYAALADCYAILRGHGVLSARDSRADAFEAVTRALELDRALAETHYSMAIFTFVFERRWRAAEPSFRRAIALNPKWALPRAHYGLFLACAYRVDEAVAETNAARDLEPASAVIHGIAALTLGTAGQFEASVEAAKRALELYPDHPVALWALTVALYGLDRHDEGARTMERGSLLFGTPFFFGLLAFGYARSGHAQDAERLLRDLEERRMRGEHIAPFALLPALLGLREINAIRGTLKSCLQDATPPVSLRAVCGPFLDDFRYDADIQDLLEQLYDGAHPR